MSSDLRTIIHFTKKTEQLKGILRIGFKVKYCRERIMFGDTEKKIRVPVVSFCDIPISQAEENMSKYGRYALGLTEQWAIKQGLTPVIYLQRHSSLAQSLLRSLDFGIAAASQAVENGPLMDALDILRYTKNYVGELTRDGTSNPEYYFADEREWRYALKTKHFSRFLYMEEMAKHPGMAEMMQQFIEDERLSFTSNDVRYILIKKEDERSEIESHIRSLHAEFTEADRESLISKVCTIEQITENS